MTDLLQRPSFYDQIALDAARQIEGLSNNMNASQKTARIQLIVLKAMCRALRTPDRRTRIDR